MTFDTAALAPLAKTLERVGLPALATILGTVAPFPFNLLVGPALQAIGAALGIDAPDDVTPETVRTRIEADPAAATAKLKPVEDAHAEAAEELRSRLADVADARAATTDLAKAGSVIAWGAPVVSVVAVAGFVLVACLVLFGHGGDTNGGQQILGAMTVGWTTVLTYWLGSSKGSADKTGELASLARAALGTGAPARRATR